MVENKIKELAFDFLTFTDFMYCYLHYYIDIYKHEAIQQQTREQKTNHLPIPFYFGIKVH